MDVGRTDDGARVRQVRGRPIDELVRAPGDLASGELANEEDRENTGGDHGDVADRGPSITGRHPASVSHPGC